MWWSGLVRRRWALKVQPRSGGIGTHRVGRPDPDGAGRARRLPRMDASSGQQPPQPILANSILPARREPITLTTADGQQLIGELALPLAKPPAATVIMLHPLPTQGGFMDSHVIRKASYRLPALADIAILRFNTRGTRSEHGVSTGSFDEARGERFDVAAAIEYVEFNDLPQPWLVGWSFGSDLALMYGCDPSVVGAILLSPPRRFSTDAHLKVWADSDKPVTALIPEFDDFLRPEQAAAAFAALPQCELIPIAGGKHLWVGEAAVRRALQEIVAKVRPELGCLPEVW